MSELLTNVPVANGYTTPATLGPALDVEQLVFQVFGEPVYAQFFTLETDPDSRQAPVLDPTEYYFPVGTLLSVSQCGGARFRNAISGSPATINAWIGFKGDPLFDFQSSGLFSAAVLTLSFLHNNALVGAESALDFEDSTALTWSVVDTPGTKEAVSALLTFGTASGGPPPTIFTFSTSVSTGPANNGRATVGTWIEQGTGRVLSTSPSPGPTTSIFAAAVQGDAQWRYSVDSNGTASWGSGAAVADAIAGRTSTTGFSWTTATNVYTGASFIAGMGGDGASPLFNAVGAAAGAALNGGGVVQVSRASSSTNPCFTITNPGATTDWRFAIESEGTIKWAAANAANDLVLGRVVNLPTGTGTFLELTAGAGFGYGVGTGGVIASIVSGSSGTLNKPTGKFTGSAAIATGAFGTYTVTNSCVGIDDVPIVALVSGGGNSQRAIVVAVAAGSFTVLYENNSGVSQTPVINFVLLKGAQS